MQRQRPADQRPPEKEGKHQKDRADDQGSGHELGRPLRQIVVDVEFGEKMPGDQQSDQNKGRGDQQHPAQQPGRKTEERRRPRDHAPKSGPQPRQRALLARMDHAGHQGDVQHGADDTTLATTSAQASPIGESSRRAMS